MDDTDSSTSPIDTVADTVGERTIAALEMLGHETRLAILLALWEAKDPDHSLPDPSGQAISFSDLYNRVDIDDSGNFTYHLDQLVGLFVRNADEGYSLTTRGEHVLSAVLAGTLSETAAFEDEPIEGSCHLCGGGLVIDYSDGTLVERCTDCAGAIRRPDGPAGVLLQGYRPPAGLANRTPQEMHRNGNTWFRNRLDSMLEGVCPDCSGPVSSSPKVCRDHARTGDGICDRCGSVAAIMWLHTCEVCKNDQLTPPTAPIWTDMTVWSFCHERGVDVVDLFDSPGWSELRNLFTDEAVVAEDPIEIRVTLELDGDRLDVFLDEAGTVTDVSQMPG